MKALRRAAIMAFGKVRRTFAVACRKKTVLKKLQRRHGECARCGACCKLLLKCPAYREVDGAPRCSVYEERPGVCGLFPLDEKDLRERDFVNPHQKCGFHFNGLAPNPVSHESTRWGPARKRPDGLPKVCTGLLAVLWTCFSKHSEGS